MKRCWSVLLVVALGLVACGGDSAEPTRTMLVVGTEMAFDAPATVPAGDYVVTFRNDGAIFHELAFRNPQGDVVMRRSIAAGQRVTLRVELVAGVWELACHEPGHYEGGMHRRLTVESADR